MKPEKKLLVQYVRVTVFGDQTSRKSYGFCIKQAGRTLHETWLKATFTLYRPWWRSVSHHPTRKHMLNPPDVSYLYFISWGIQDIQAGVDCLLDCIHLQKDGPMAKACKIGFLRIPSGNGLMLSPVACVTNGSGRDKKKSRTKSSGTYVCPTFRTSTKVYCWIYQIQSAM